MTLWGVLGLVGRTGGLRKLLSVVRVVSSDLILVCSVVLLLMVLVMRGPCVLGLRLSVFLMTVRVCVSWPTLVRGVGRCV